jgi:hypothetical protein
MQPFYPLFFIHLNSYLTLFLCRVNNKEEEKEEEEKISTRSIEGSMSVSRRGHHLLMLVELLLKKR